MYVTVFCVVPPCNATAFRRNVLLPSPGYYPVEKGCMLPKNIGNHLNKTTTIHICEHYSSTLLLHCDAARLCLYGTAAATGPWVNMEQQWNNVDIGKPKTRRETYPRPLCPPQIPHGLPWARSRASAVRSRRLNAWAVARSVRHVTAVQACSVMYYIVVKRGRWADLRSVRRAGRWQFSDHGNITVPLWLHSGQRE
jgi:hypothetical protein